MNKNLKYFKTFNELNLSGGSISENCYIHIINPYSINGSLDLVQRRTLESIFSAKKIASNSVYIVAVINEDEGFLEDYDFDFIINGSENDEFDVFFSSVNKSLPSIFQIIKEGINVSVNSDFIIYTNMDINITLNFYDFLNILMPGSFDGVSINRRTIDGNLINYPKVHSHTHSGITHPGSDCFVFKTRIFNDFIKFNTVLGSLHVMKGMLYNLVVHCNSFGILTDLFITYHYGDDRAWLNSNFNPIEKHNEKEIMKLVNSFKGKDSINKLKMFCIERCDIVLYRSISNKFTITEKFRFIFLRFSNMLKRFFGKYY